MNNTYMITIKLALRWQISLAKMAYLWQSWVIFGKYKYKASFVFGKYRPKDKVSDFPKMGKKEV